MAENNSGDSVVVDLGLSKARFVSKNAVRQPAKKEKRSRKRKIKNKKEKEKKEKKKKEVT